MESSVNIQSLKLELMQKLLETQDAGILNYLSEVFKGTESESFELSEAQKAELDLRTQLRHEGKLNTSPWNEVKGRILGE